jgi:dTDP-4-amino-4,6-dideoxygalactose transaminase
MLTYDEKEVCNYQYIVLEIDEQTTLIGRDQIMQILHAENVIARRYFYPGCHRMEPYRSYQPYASLLVPATEQLVERILILPTGTSVSEKHIQKIGQIFRFVIENATDITSKMDPIDAKGDYKLKPITENYKVVSLS